MAFAPQYRNLLAAFLAQNASLSLTYGSYGSLLHEVELNLGIGRAMASSGMSAQFAALCLFSPVVGKVLQSVSIRMTMAAGAIILSCGWLALSLMTNFGGLLLGYALIGAANSILGIIAPATLVSRWFRENRGKALGFANLPLSLIGASTLVTMLLPSVGFRGVFVTFAIFSGLLVPIFLYCIVDGAPAVEKSGSSEQSASSLSLDRLLRSGPFWLLTFGIGIQSAVGATFLVHFIPFASSIGHSEATASAMLAGFGMAGIVGTYAFGWLSDVIRPHLVFALTSFLLAALWALLLTSPGAPALFVLVCLLGACGAGQVALQGAAASDIFGVAYVNVVLGVIYAVKLPLVFIFPPLTGYLFDKFMNYDTAIFVNVAVLIVAMGSFIAISKYGMAGAWRRSGNF